MDSKTRVLGQYKALPFGGTSIMTNTEHSIYEEYLWVDIRVDGYRHVYAWVSVHDYSDAHTTVSEGDY